MVPGLMLANTVFVLKIGLAIRHRSKSDKVRPFGFSRAYIV